MNEYDDTPTPTFIVPAPYELWRNGVFSSDDPKGGDVTQDAPEGRQLILHRPIQIGAAATHLETSAVRYQLQFTTVAHQYRQAWVPAAVFGSRDLVRTLADLGYPIDLGSERQLSAYLLAFLSENGPRLPHGLLTEAYGEASVNGSSVFCFHDEVVGLDQGQLVVDAATPVGGSLGVSGDLDTWLDFTRAQVAQSPAVAVALAGALSAPLLRSSRQRNYLLYFWGQSGLGKSAAHSLAVSTYGQVNGCQGLFSSLDRTEAATAALLESVSGLPVALDEFELARGRVDPMRLVYSLASNKRERSTQQGKLRQSRSTNVVIMLNGEAPLEDYSVKRKSLGGVENRCLSFHIQSPLPAKQIYALTAEHFGHAGRHYLRALLPRLHEVRDQFVEFETGIAEQLASGPDGRSAIGASLALGAYYGREILGLPFPDPVEFGVSCLGAAEASRQVEDAASLSERALTALREYLMERPLATYAANTGSTPVLCYRMNDECWLVPSLADRVLRDADLPPGRVWKELAGTGALKSSGRNLKLGRVLFNGGRQQFRVLHTEALYPSALPPQPPPDDDGETVPGSLPFQMPNLSEVQS